MSLEDQRWLLSYYAHSERQGARFFERLVRVVPGELRADLQRHAQDEAQHAHWWNEVLEARNETPMHVERAYQDAYLEAAGLPLNVMEVLALTHVFERRTAGQYSIHRARPGLDPHVARVLDDILQDEGRHLSWTRNALARLGHEYGDDTVHATLQRYAAADREVYRRTREELLERHPDLEPQTAPQPPNQTNS